MSKQDHGRDATRAGFIAPLVGIAVMVIVALAVNVWVGIIVGAAAMIATIPIVLRIMQRRRDRES